MMRVAASSTGRRGITLIEFLMMLVVIGLYAALIVWAVQGHRETSRRLWCVNNLRQISEGVVNYVSSNEVLPPGSLAALDAGRTARTHGLSALVRILPYFDSSALYNSANFDLRAMAWANGTVATNGPSIFCCPSDPYVAESHAADLDYGAPAGFGIRQRHTSYGGCQGAWSIDILPDHPAYAAQLANMNGVLFNDSSIRVADITDGTGSTILFAETAYGKIPKTGDRPSARWWNSGQAADSMVAAYYPLNGALKGVPYLGGNSESWVMTAGSFHPGGANVSFCDGSVRFLKDSIQSVPFEPTSGDVPAFRRDPTTETYSIAPGVRLGVWQKLSTRNFGDAPTAGSY